MKIFLISGISTSVVIVLSIISTMPAFIKSSESSETSSPLVVKVMLSFSITNEDGSSEWCNELSRVLKDQNLKATVFFSGKVGELNSECISDLASNTDIDIGSQTYSYQALTSYNDYLDALHEVQLGKEALDLSGNIDSKLFKAPYGLTDENIFSYLSRNGIVADFSYHDHYNYYHGDQFLRYEARVTQGLSLQPELLSSPNNKIPIIVEFDDSSSIEDVKSKIIEIRNLGKTIDQGILFVNASHLTGTNLTLRGEQS